MAWCTTAAGLERCACAADLVKREFDVVTLDVTVDQRIERENKVSPGTDFATLPKITRDNILITKAKLAFADAGRNFCVNAGDAGAVAKLRAVLGDGVEIAEGQDFQLKGHVTEEVREWLFRGSSKGMFLVQKVLEAESNLRKDSLRTEESEVKNS